MLKSTKSDHLESIALAPIYLYDRCDSLEAVKETGKTIERLAEYKIISLDYDIPLENGDYDDYKTSDVFAYFKETITEGTVNPDFILTRLRSSSEAWRSPALDRKYLNNMNLY